MSTSPVAKPAVIDKFDQEGNLIESFGDTTPSPNGQLAGTATPAGSFSPVRWHLPQLLRHRRRSGHQRPLRDRRRPPGDRRLRPDRRLPPPDHLHPHWPLPGWWRIGCLQHCRQRHQRQRLRRQREFGPRLSVRFLRQLCQYLGRRHPAQRLGVSDTRRQLWIRLDFGCHRRRHRQRIRQLRDLPRSQCFRCHRQLHLPPGRR